MLEPPEIQEYAEASTTPPTELLKRLAEETKGTLRAPQMLTGQRQKPAAHHDRKPRSFVRSPG